MLQNILISALLSLNYIVMILSHLKWAWDYLLYQSFFQPRGISLSDYFDNLSGGVRHRGSSDLADQVAECAVCLCRIDHEGEEVRELRCNHLFHKVCLDRWLGLGHVTCPLCRNNVKPRRFTAELHQEVVEINFCATRSSDGRRNWWLR